MNKLSKGLTMLLVVAVVAVGFVSRGCSIYNAMVTMDEAVTSAWAEVQNQYQRRYDLIPNLVSTVKGYATHESDVFTQVTEARARAGGELGERQADGGSHGCGSHRRLLS